jgi:hypothetical protein
MGRFTTLWFLFWFRGQVLKTACYLMLHPLCSWDGCYGRKSINLKKKTHPSKDSPNSVFFPDFILTYPNPLVFSPIYVEYNGVRIWSINSNSLGLIVILPKSKCLSFPLNLEILTWFIEFWKALNILILDPNKLPSYDWIFNCSFLVLKIGLSGSAVLWDVESTQLKIQMFIGFVL